jgi:hypothetical protein
MSVCKKNDYTFLLKNIDINKIQEEYPFLIKQNSLVDKFEEELEVEDNNSEHINYTPIENILSVNSTQHQTFLEHNNNSVSMIDYVNGMELGERSTTNCFWCRHAFEGKPISCPISYKNNQIEKDYFSEITKDRYTLKENIDMSKFEQMNDVCRTNSNIKIIKKDYYISDGIFCSFNCCLSFINDNKNNSFYKNSKCLLLLILKKTTGETVITPAPSWRLLDRYGGSLSIEQFRTCFNRLQYFHLNIVHTHFRPIGFSYFSNIKC